MIELLIFAVGYAFLAALNFYRLAKGPTAADRMVAGDSMDVLVCCALVLYAMYSGRGIYLDIALIPVGGFYTIDADSAARLIARIRPRIVIPMHYSTGYNASWPIAPLDKCLAALNAADAPRMPLLRVTKEDLSEHPAIIVLEENV